MKHSDAVLLRPAGALEAPAMAVLSRDLIETGLGWRYTPRQMQALIDDPETIALVACGHSRVQGFAVMAFGDDDAHLVLLCVQPALQRRGLGRRLLEWLLQSARVAGTGTVRLELRADNAAALAFYRGLGFVESGLVPGYYDGRIAARRMALPLRSA